jgi:outer membrane protein OmpU
MKNIMKTLLVSIASLSLMFSVNAGELSVSGSAKATYLTSNGVQADNGIGITNELNFTASGEMDNGYTWSYSMELDPDTTDGSALNDDTQVAIGMGDLGTVKICVSECGNGKKYSFAQDAYTQMTDTGLSPGANYPIDAGSYASLQYHTPSLPLSTVITAAYGQQKNDGQSGNTQGGGSGDSFEGYSLTSSPIEGLTLTAAYYDINDYDDGDTSEDQLQEGGSYNAEYAIGNITVGYGKAFLAPEASAITAGGTTVEYYENTGMSVGYAVNDELSVSYTREKNERNMQTSTTTTYDIETDSVQLAYSLGGATLSVAHADYENVSYSQ